MSKDSLGDRMKEFYENRTRYYLPRRTHTIIRVDGKAFHTYTRGLKKPFDEDFTNDMNETAKFLCENIQGARCAFVQSDEISVLLTDYNKLGTSAWFDGNIQKICSIAASSATAKFNQLRLQRFHANMQSRFEEDILIKLPLAMFDARVFTIPQDYEVENYFVWRQQDCTRNSIESVAQSLYSHKELHGVNCNNLQELIFQKGINWNDYSIRYKRGGLILKKEYETATPYISEELKQTTVYRTKWEITDPPIFTEEKGFIINLL